MKKNLILAIFVGLFGIVFGSLAGLYIQQKFFAHPDGHAFESLEDLRMSMLERDERDVQAGGSVSFRTIVSPHPSDRIIFDLKPNLSNIYFQGVPLETNSCGMRDIERPIPKPNDTMRIALLGDSFAFGWGVEVDRIFANVLQRKLQEFVGDVVNIEVLNFGIPGYSTFQEVAQFEDRVIPFDPDIVLVYFITNDFGLPFYVRQMDSEALTTADSFERYRRSIEDPEERARVESYIHTIDANHSLARLADVVEPMGVSLFLALNTGGHFQSDLERLWILREDPRVQFINMQEDILDYVDGYGIDRSLLSLPNDPHPSALRHGILGRLLALHLAQEVLFRAGL